MESSKNDELPAVIVFNACPPSQRFEPNGSRSQTTMIGAFVPVGGIPQQKLSCGRNSGLKILDGTSSPPVLEANETTRFDDTKGFSLSLLFQPGNTSLQELQTILTMSSSLGNDQNDDENVLDGCRGYLLHIGQYGPHILLRYRDASASCRVLLLRSKVNLAPSSLALLTFTANTTRTIAYLNETMIGQWNGLDFSSSSYDEADGRQIRLLGSEDKDVDYFRGSLYQFLIYNESLSDTQTMIANVANAATFPMFGLPGLEEPSPLVIPQESNETHGLLIPLPEMPRLEICIISLPDKGLLRANGETVVVGSNLTVTKHLEYTMSDNGFFNTPHINTHEVNLNVSNEFFSYRLKAYDNDGFMVAQSEALEYSVFVQAVNHPPKLLAPSHIEVGTSKSSGVVSNVELLDALDHDVNLVRVDISSRRGSLTVATEKARSMLRQYDCSGRSASPWQCTGDGLRDRRLVFVVAPSDVTRILKGLEYTSLTAGRPEADNVTVAIYDGQDGDCLTADEHWSYQEALGNVYPSLHPNGCVVVQADIRVPGATVEASGGGYGFDRTHGAESALPDLLFWMIVLMVLCCFCGSRVRKCARKGTAVDADDDSHQGGDAANVPRAPQETHPGMPTDASVMSSMYWDEFTLT